VLAVHAVSELCSSLREFRQSSVPLVRETALIVITGVSLLGIIVAWMSGSRFVGTMQTASMTMAVATGVSILAMRSFCSSFLDRHPRKNALTSNQSFHSERLQASVMRIANVPMRIVLACRWRPPLGKRSCCLHVVEKTGKLYTNP